jgi:hypothetical protein
MAGRGGSGGGGGSGGASGGAGGGSGGAAGSAADAGARDSAAAGGSTGADAARASDGGTSTMMSFFVSSQKNMTGNLGGLAGADKRCQDLAAAVGLGGKTWHAYLSVDKGPNGTPVNAKDRIGKGPWYNSKGALLAMDVASLHMRSGDAATFLDEHGNRINGQWAGSPAPVEHDILTGSKADGTLEPGKTCMDWTSTAANIFAVVGHADGLGPNMAMDPMYRSWNSSHDNGGCNDTGPKGGAGRIYCFAAE